MIERSQLHFVLDHNVPYQVVRGIDWPPYLRLSGLKDAAPHLIDEPDDWRILLALAELGGVDGYITNDGKMLDLAEEMAALMRTRLTLVVTLGSGHAPLRASGLLMAYLPEIARQLLGQPSRPSSTIFRLSAAQIGQFRLRPGQQIDRIAERRGIAPQRLLTATLRSMHLGPERPT